MLCDQTARKINLFWNVNWALWGKTMVPLKLHRGRCHNLYSRIYFHVEDHGRVHSYTFMEMMEVIIRTSEWLVDKKRRRGWAGLPLNRVHIASMSLQRCPEQKGRLPSWTIIVNSLCKSSSMSIVQREPAHKALSTHQQRKDRLSKF